MCDADERLDRAPVPRGEAPIAGASTVFGRRWPLAPPWTAAAGVCAGLALVALVDPREQPLSPPCPFRLTTGWWCPFCGGTRAASRLVRGDVGAALRYNGFVVALVPIVLAFWLGWAVPGRVAMLDRLRSRSAAWARALLVLAVCFTVVRNLPFASGWLRFPGA